MANVYNLAAASCVAPIAPAAQSLLDAKGGAPTVSPAYGTNDTKISPRLNEGGRRADLNGRFGGGTYGIVKGLTLSQSVAGKVDVAAGQAMLDGIAQQTASSSWALTVSQNNWIFFLPSGAVTVIAQAGFPAAPSAVCCYLGMLAVDGSGNFTNVDLSGVVYLEGGIGHRRTADAGAPADTPPAGYTLFTRGANDLYWWDGAAYWTLTYSSTNPLPVAKGGTGGATAAAARANLSAALLGANNDITSMSALAGTVKNSGQFKGSSSPFQFAWETLALSDAAYTLGTGSAGEKEYLYQQFTGALTAARTITLPLANGAVYYVWNATTGGQNLTFIGASGTGIVVPAGMTARLYSDGTNWYREGPNWDPNLNGIVGMLYAATADGTVTNTTSETSVVGTGVGTKTIAANTLVPGKTIRIRARGFWTTSGTPPTLQLKAKLGSTVIVQLPNAGQTLTASQTGRYWEVDVLLTCRTRGASGTVHGQGRFGWSQVTANTYNSWQIGNTAASTIDTTASQVVDLTATFGGVDASTLITCTHFEIELAGPP